MISRGRLVFDLYERHRWQDQLTYYTERRDEYEAASRQASGLVALLMIATAAVSGAAVFDESRRPVWTFAAVLLPTLATAVAGYARLYAFEQLAATYGAAIGGLRRARRVSPGIRIPPDVADFDAALAHYVRTVEAVSRRESSQWGQLISDVEIASMAQPGDQSAIRDGGSGKPVSQPRPTEGA